MSRQLFPWAVVSSDLHNEYCAYVTHPEMWGDSYHATRQLVDYAGQYGVPLILAGDLFDKAYPDSYTLMRVFRMVNQLGNRPDPLNVLFTQGQHELCRRQPWLSLAGHPEHLHEVPYDIKGVGVYGLDWLPADQLAAAMPKVPGQCSVLVCHQVWAEFMGSIACPEGSLAELVPDHVRLVITGDFHGHRVLHLKNKNGRPFTVLSPGSTTLQAIGEDPVKYCFLVLSDGREFEVRSLPLRGRRFLHASVRSDGQLADVAGLLSSYEVPAEDLALPAELRKPMYVVWYDGVVEGVSGRLREAAKGRCHLFLRLLDGGKGAAEEDKAAEVGNLEAALAASGLGPSDVLYADALRLLRSHDVAAEVETLVAEILEEEHRVAAGPFAP